MTTRRRFVSLLGGAAAASSGLTNAAPAQQPERVRRRRIGVLMGSRAIEPHLKRVAAFARRLEELGWSNERNIRIDVRWWEGTPEQARAAVAELISFSPDVIVAYTNLALATLKPVAGRIPIVFVAVADPVESGLVASLAHPGGTVTGFTSNEGSMGGKWLEILKETVPRLTGALVLLHSETPAHQAFWRSIQEAAARLGMNVSSAAIDDATEIERAISIDATKSSGLMVLPHALANLHQELIDTLALRHRLPAVSAGGGSPLVAYGVDFQDSFRRVADYVDRILRGEKAGELPVQQPTKFHLVVNLKIARAIGVEVPPMLLARADEVLE